MEFGKFGEGFWVTVVFMAFASVILCVAMITRSELATSVASSIVTVIGMIAAFWFPTRGQTSQTHEVPDSPPIVNM